MSYDARESSVHDGAPVELYEFHVGTTVLRYTSQARDVEVDSQTWLARPLKRGSIETSHEGARNLLQLDCARDFEVAELFRVSPPSDAIALIVRRVHRGDTEVAAIWVGKVTNCEWTSGVRATLECQSARSSLRRAGLRRMYQRSCPHVLYGPKCGVSQAAHSITTTVTAISGASVTVAALLDRPYPGGWLEWTRPSGLVDRRFISKRTGLQLQLSLSIFGLAVGQSVKVLPGCDHTTGMCEDTYANLDRHGGFPLIPKKNPFGQAPVF